MAQWIRTHIPEQGAGVRSPVPEDSTCGGASKSSRHHYSAHALQLLEAGCPRTRALQQEEPRNEKSTHGIEEQPLLPTNRGRWHKSSEDPVLKKKSSEVMPLSSSLFSFLSLSLPFYPSSPPLALLSPPSPSLLLFLFLSVG